jgi:TP901 family phage tail tape measure protein
MTDTSLNIQLTGQDISASSALMAVGSVAQNLAGGGMLGGISLAAAAAGVALVGIGAASATMAAQYQQSENMVQALTGSSTQQMAAYDAGLKTLAADAGVAPNALAQGLYNVLSAGKSGADAMNVLTLATEDAKIGMTDATTTTDALTNILNSFSVKAADTTRVNGEMLQTVTLGKSTFSQYATTIVGAASASVQFNTSMETMNAAWATLTSSGISAAHATTDYDQSLKVMDGNIGTVSKSLQKNGIAFNETKFNAMDYGDKVVTLNAALDQARAKHISITGATIQATQAIQTISQHIGVYNTDLAALSDKQSMAQKTQQAWAITQSGFNQQLSQLQATIQVAMIGIGNALLPMLGQFVGSIRQVVTSFMAWESQTHGVEQAAQLLLGGILGLATGIGRIVTFVSQSQVAMNLFKGTLAAVAVVVGVAMVSAFYAWATAAGAAAIATIAATWPVLAVAAAIGVLVAGFLALYNNVAPFRAFMQQLGAGFQQVWGIISANFMPIMQQLGSFLASVFLPVWQQMVATWQTQVIPAWNGLMAAIQPIMPQLQAFGQFLGVIVGTAILVVVGLIGGLIGALGGLLTGIAVIIGGVTTFIAGTIQYISGIIAFFVDLFTGKFDKLGGDLGTIWGGVVKMFEGAWQVIEGVFVGAINGLIGLINGFVAGVLGPLNSILTASGQAALSVGKIPMLSVGVSASQTAAAPTYVSGITQQKATTPSGSAPPALPTTLSATTPVSIPASSLSPVTGAVNTASAKSAAAALKSQQAAQVAAMKVSDTLSKATATSGSSQVQALVQASQQATAQGNTALAAYDAGKAATLAGQQKAAATKAASVATKAAKAATAVTTKAAKAAQVAATKAAKAASVASAKAAKASASTKAAATKAAVAAQNHAQVLAAHAASLAQSAANQKALVTQLQQSTTQVIAQQCPGGVSAIPTALGVALPNYATGTGYTQNAPVVQQAPAAQSQTVHHHYNVTVNSDSNDPKEHGKKIADAIKDHLANKLRGQSIAPRYLSGGAH